MDVADDNKDVRLYRASADLLPEIKAKLPLLVWHQGQGRSELEAPRVRKWVIDAKTDEVIQRVSLTRYVP